MNYNTHGQLQYKKALVKYEELVTKLYKEPEDGKLEDVIDEVLEGLDSDTDEEEEQDQ